MNSSASAQQVNMIMIVDDNDTDNFLHKRVIELSGITKNVIVKDSGKAALEYLHQHKNHNDKFPNIIFLDLKMPDLDGFGFLSEFQNFSEDIKNNCKIIILSSSNNEKDFERIKKYGFVKTYLTKPLLEESLFKLN